MVNARILCFCGFLLLSITSGAQSVQSASLNTSTPDTTIIKTDSASIAPVFTLDTLTSNLISFAQSLKGIPYKYACADPKKGFDCSGFVMYVFNHFKLKVPRSSIDFTHVGKEIDIKDAIPGDIILFTGTDSRIRKVGHVGIVTQVTDTLVFIHASSGKTPAVIETALNPHYKKRFIKVIRVM
jgi:cell wall-associated NlpC family hydrolase